MNSHKNAKLTARGREEMVRRMRLEPAARVAAGFGVSLRTARKWASRYNSGGTASLADRSSRPKRCRSKLSEEDMGGIVALRKERLTGDQIALRLGFCQERTAHLPVWTERYNYRRPHSALGRKPPASRLLAG